MVLEPGRATFERMKAHLAAGSFARHPEFRRGGFLDQAWLDLFWRFYRRAHLGVARYDGNWAFETFLDAGDDWSDYTEFAEDEGAGPAMALLPLEYNLLVSFPAINWPDESGLDACTADLLARASVLHWPGDAWKPWQRWPLARSSFDELWWEAYREMCAAEDAHPCVLRCDM